MTDGSSPVGGTAASNGYGFIALAWCEVASNAAGMCAAGYLYFTQAASSTWHGPEIAFGLFSLGFLVMIVSFGTTSRLRRVLAEDERFVTDPVLRRQEAPKSALVNKFIIYFIISSSLFMVGCVIAILSWKHGI